MAYAWDITHRIEHHDNDNNITPAVTPSGLIPSEDPALEFNFEVKIPPVRSWWLSPGQKMEIKSEQAPDAWWLDIGLKPDGDLEQIHEDAPTRNVMKMPQWVPNNVTRKGLTL